MTINRYMIGFFQLNLNKSQFVSIVSMDWFMGKLKPETSMILMRKSCDSGLIFTLKAFLDNNNKSNWISILMSNNSNTNPHCFFQKNHHKSPSITKKSTINHHQSPKKKHRSPKKSPKITIKHQQSPKKSP